MATTNKQTTAPTPGVMDLMLGGLPSGSNTGQQTALAAMMGGPGSDLSPYMKLGGSEYADMLDQMMLNPMNSWF